MPGNHRILAIIHMVDTRGEVTIKVAVRCTIACMAMLVVDSIVQCRSEVDYSILGVILFLISTEAIALFRDLSLL